MPAGNIGSYHVYGEFGNTMTASMFGNGAAALGAGPASWLGRTLLREPEAFPMNLAVSTAAEVDRGMGAGSDHCGIRCAATTRVMRLTGAPISEQECLDACRGSGSARSGSNPVLGIFGGPQVGQVVLVLIGIGLLLVGAAAVVKS